MHTVQKLLQNSNITLLQVDKDSTIVIFRKGTNIEKVQEMIKGGLPTENTLYFIRFLTLKWILSKPFMVDYREERTETWRGEVQDWDVHGGTGVGILFIANEW